MQNHVNKKTHHGKSKKNGTIPESYTDDSISTSCCFCIKTSKSQRKGLIAGFITNLGIFALLFAYTFLGAFLFLAIEGNGTRIHHQTLAATSYQASQKVNSAPLTKLNGTLTQLTSELRSQTVESIWEITVSLNILYKENWTRLAAQEIARFQEKLIAKVAADISAQYGPPGAKALESAPNLLVDEYEWNFPKAFLYSLTVLTTIGYGSVTPRTAAGKAVTIGYAVVGIPLTLLYLSVVGALLSRVVRGIFNKALCCCLCNSCNFCCLDEKAIVSGRKDKNKKPEDFKMSNGHLQEPYYVRSSSGTIISASQAQNVSFNNKDKNPGLNFLRDCDSLSCTDTESKISMHGLTLLAPISLCLFSMFIYIFFGAFVLYYLEGWSPIDGIYFCFMSLSTIGFGHVAPGASYKNGASNGTIWFCSFYIVTGLALTAMCFNVLHDEIVHRLRHREKLVKMNSSKMMTPEFLRRS